MFAPSPDGAEFPKVSGDSPINKVLKVWGLKTDETHLLFDSKKVKKALIGKYKGFEKEHKPIATEYFKLVKKATT